MEKTKKIYDEFVIVGSDGIDICCKQGVVGPCEYYCFNPKLYDKVEAACMVELVKSDS